LPNLLNYTTPGETLSRQKNLKKSAR